MTSHSGTLRNWSTRNLDFGNTQMESGNIVFCLRFLELYYLYWMIENILKTTRRWKCWSQLVCFSSLLIPALILTLYM